MTEICTEEYRVNGHDVDRETSIKFLMARKFDVERAKTLFNANLVSYSLVVIAIQPRLHSLSFVWGSAQVKTMAQQ